MDMIVSDIYCKRVRRPRFGQSETRDKSRIVGMDHQLEIVDLIL